MPNLEFALNITFRQGDDYPFSMAFYEDDDVTPIAMGSPKKLGLTIKPLIDDDDTDANAYIALNTADFVVDPDPDGGGAVNNRVNVLLPRALTKLIPVGTHYVDFQVLDAANHLQTQGFGSAVCTPQTGRRIPT